MFEYFTDEEYQRAFSDFEGIRTKIAEFLKQRFTVETGRILDLLAGHGYLSAELARVFPQATLYATGLRNDLESFLKLKQSEHYPKNVWRHVKYVDCDVTSLPFDDYYFDLAANFLGLEDVMMTKGRHGLSTMISEVSRVIRPNGVIEIALVEYGDTPEERVAEEIWSSIGLNAVFLDKAFYVGEFQKHGFSQHEEWVLQVRKKMTCPQAEEELRFACEQAPKIFSEYDIKALTLDRLMDRFGERIQEHGMAFYPNVRILIFERDR